MFSDVKWIPPTSNHVERFFSYCKNVYSDDRKRLLPVNLEMQVYLKVHFDLWVDDHKLLLTVWNEYKNRKDNDNEEEQG